MPKSNHPSRPPALWSVRPVESRSDRGAGRLPSLDDDDEELIVKGDEDLMPLGANPQVPQLIL